MASEVTTRVYQYRFYPDAIPDGVTNQLRLANDLWNTLVNYERSIDQRSQAIWRRDPVVDGLYRQVEALEAERADSRRAVFKPRIVQLYQTIATRKKEVHDTLEPVFAQFWNAIREEKKKQIKEIRQQYAEAGLHFGTYNDVIDRYMRASYHVAQRRKRGLPSQLRFHRFDGTGSLTLQIIQTARRPPFTLELLAQDGGHPYRNQARIVPVPEFGTGAARGLRRQASRVRVMVRMGTGADRDPLWLQGRLVMHRLWPPAAAVKRIRWVRERVGTHFRDSLHFTLRFSVTEVPPANPAIIALDFGWRKDAKCLRVATWASTREPQESVTLSSVADIQAWDGTQNGVLVLPERFLAQMARVERLVATRRAQFHIVHQSLLNWLQIHAWPDDFSGESGHGSDWLQPVTIAGWRSEAPCATLAVHWRTHRFAGDEAMYREIEEWRKQDKRLYEWQSHLRDKTQGFRRELYRTFAARVAVLYGHIVMADMDLRTMSRNDRRSGSDKLSPQHAEAANHQRHLAAPHTLRNALRHAANARQLLLTVLPSTHTTRRCVKCGMENYSTDYAATIRVVCPHCGRESDQDATAAENLLRTARAPRILHDHSSQAPD